MLDQLNTALGSRLCSQPGQATEVKCQANKSGKEALAVKRQCPLPTWDTASLPLEYPRVSAIIELKRSFHSLQIKHQVGISGVPVMAKRTGPRGWNSEETGTNGYWQFLNREPDSTLFSHSVSRGLLERLMEVPVGSLVGFPHLLWDSCCQWGIDSLLFLGRTHKIFHPTIFASSYFTTDSRKTFYSGLSDSPEALKPLPGPFPLH